MSELAVGRLKLTFEMVEAGSATPPAECKRSLTVVNIQRGGEPVCVQASEAPILIGHNGTYLAVASGLHRLDEMIEILLTESTEIWMMLLLADAEEAESFITGVATHASAGTKNFWTNYRVDSSPDLLAARQSTERAVRLHF